jgi:hypothetical protein
LRRFPSRINTPIESKASRWSDFGYVDPTVVTNIARVACLLLDAPRVRARSGFRKTLR